MATLFNYVYRSGAAAGSPLPSFYTCVTTAEITSPVEGDTAYQTSTKTFVVYNGSNWVSLDNADLADRVALLEFLVAAIIEKGFGGL